MANFKNPRTNAGISTVGTDSAGNAKFRLWGGGPDGEELIVRVYRSGVVVSEGGGVTLASTDAGNWNFDYTATGLKPGDQIFGLTNLGARYTAALSVVSGSGTPLKNHLIASWAAQYATNPIPSSDYLFPDAIPYLALRHPTMGPCPTLHENCIGSRLAKVSGLAVHCTAGPPTDAFHMAAFHCIQGWNARGVSAHFGIARDGQVVQFISADHIANAQHDPGNRSWLSVEVSNTGRTEGMNADQLDSLKDLFSWVCTEFGVPSQMGTGFLGGDPKMNALTQQVCDATGSSVTRAPAAPAASPGLSCHHWLDKGRKPCPGMGILGQLPSVLKAGPQS